MRLIKSILCIPQLIVSLNKVNKQIDTLAGAIAHTQNRLNESEKIIKHLYKVNADLQDRVSVIEAFFDNLEEVATNDKNNLAN